MDRLHCATEALEYVPARLGLGLGICSHVVASGRFLSELVRYHANYGNQLPAQHVSFFPLDVTDKY